MNVTVIRGKLGTHPTTVYRVLGEYSEIKPGMTIQIQSEQDRRVIKWTHVVIDEVRDGLFYFMSLK